jgi:hypothetical protein
MRFVYCCLWIAFMAASLALTTGCSGNNTTAPPIGDGYKGPYFSDTIIDDYSLRSDSGASLRGYTELRSLHAVYTGVFDFKHVAACSLLQHIDLQADTFVNIGQMSGLSRVTYCNLWAYCSNKALDGFAGLVRLDTLSVRGFTATSDFSAVAGLPNLSIFNVNGSPLTALPIFSKANGTRMRQVAMTNCTLLRDLSGLAQCANLDELSFRNCRIVDSLIPPLPSVRTLTMVACSSLTTIRHLALMTGLESLTINGPVNDWSPLSSLVNLHYLDIGGLTDVSPLTPLTKLNHLILGDWQIGGCPQVKDITSIAGLSGISYLNIKNTAISNFNPLLTIMNAGDTVWVTWEVRDTVTNLLKSANIDAVTGASPPWNP